MLMLSGCPPPKNPTATQAPGKTGGDTEVRATEYRWPIPADPRSLDPAQLTDTVSDTVARRIFNTLVRFSPEGEVVDDLANSHTVSEDGTVYTFTLPADVKFHNGTPCTAADVAYSLQRILDPVTASPRAALLYYVKGGKEFNEGGKKDQVEGIVPVDDTTLKIVLNEPYAPFLNVLCMTSLAVVPRSEVERDPQGFGDRPIGTGPYVFDSWERDDRVTLKSNKSYFRGVANIDTLIFRVIKDEQTRFSNFESGDLEHCDIPPSKIPAVRKDEKLNALISGEPAMDMYCYGFNCEQPPFKDNTALRQAFNYAVDKQHIIEAIWGGLVTEQKTFVPEGMFYFWEDAPGYPYDVEKAKELLATAGYAGGKGLPELVLNVDLQPTNRLVAEAVQSDLQKIGVPVRLEQTDWGPFLDKIYAGEALFHQNTWLTDYPDPDNWLWQLLHSDNFGELGNTTRWSNSEFDSLVMQAQVTLDLERRKELYKQAEQIAFNEAPWLFLFWKNSSTLVQPQVKGLTITRLDRTPHLNNTAIEEVELTQ
jgi:oligopeptide transport system substrate-binding protein